MTHLSRRLASKASRVVLRASTKKVREELADRSPKIPKAKVRLGRSRQAVPKNLRVDREEQRYRSHSLAANLIWRMLCHARDDMDA